MKDRRLKELFNSLVKRKYPISILNTGIARAKSIPRSQLLSVKIKTDDDVLTYVSTHNPCNNEMFGVLKNNFNILNTDQKMKEVIKGSKIIKSKRQLPNLKRLLTKSAFSDDDTYRVSKCGEPRCGLCHHLIEGSTLTIGKCTFYVKTNMTCTVKNCLYVMKCNLCDQFYIGQTGDKLRNRVTVHRQQIKDPSTRQLPVSAHHCFGTGPNFSIFPFYKFFSDDVSARLIRENHFIRRFRPTLNCGKL